MSLTPSKGPASFVTPTKRAALSSNAEAGPSRARPQGASPAYSSRKHSLYGIEDRVVIDPGSRIWKVGYSGEPEPRACFWANDDGEAWDLDLSRIKGARGDREEGRRIVEATILQRLRDTFVKHLMTDAKSRKVIVVENSFLPTYVKDAIAKALFENLRVPSVSFTPSSLLCLASCGRVTGLVVDCGWLETTITPVFASRPLFRYARSTPLAGRSIHSRDSDILMRGEPDHEAESVPQAVLTAVLKLPVDLRTIMASNILVVGGTACAPNFIPRIRDSLATLLEPTNPTFQPNDMSVSAWKARSHEPYRELYGLKSSIAILNDPRPAEARGGSKGGTAPRWAPSLMPWIGGSLAGALKTGAPELVRGEYDALYAESFARGDHYRAAIEEARSGAEDVEALGISVDDLQPGMALLGTGRRRGWTDGVSVNDWSRPGVAV